jgi:hypothetical protein
MEAIHIHSWSDMQQLGLNVLTGEACKFAQRLLCDVNEDGAALMLDYLGVAMLGKNWNSTVNGKPAVGSVMLHRESLLQVAEFAILRMPDLRAIIYKGGAGVSGLFTCHMTSQYLTLLKDWPSTTDKWTMRRVGKSDPNVSEGSRNIHQASGRVV